MISIQSINFLDSFEQEYNRNNRKSKQKSLRCFPLCLTKGHSDSGFCGRAVTVSVRCSGQEVNPSEKLVFVGELHRFGCDDMSMESFKKGSFTLTQVVHHKFSNLSFENSLSFSSYNYFSIALNCNS